MTTDLLPSTILFSRAAVAGVLLFLMIGLTIISGFRPDSFVFIHWLSGFIAVAAALLLFPDVNIGPRIQVSILLFVGVALLFYAYRQGVAVSVPEVVSRNTGLLTMIMSVGFLRLIVAQDNDLTSALPIGRRAYLNTLIGVGVFGSVINISAPIVICDRLALQSPTDLFTARSVTRVFSACAAWSPYFAGAAVVLTYVGGVQLARVMASGLPFLLIAIVLVYKVALKTDNARVERFYGYPMSLSSMWIPVFLTVLVIVMHQLMPELSILVVIALSALMLTATMLISRYGWRVGVGRLTSYVRDGLPKTVNELLLFLSAGVLAAGLTGMVDAGLIKSSLSNFSVTTASILLAIMVVVSAMGIHPVIQISGLTPLVLTANPDPDLLALTYLFAWSLGTCASPLSGTHLIFQGRYAIPAWRGAVQNWGYVVVMYCVAVVLLKLHSMIF